MIRYVPLGDSAITVVLGEGISRPLSDEVLRVADGLRSASIAGVTEVIPAYASLGIYYDPLDVGMDELLQRVKPVVEGVRTAGQNVGTHAAKTIRIPVRYNGEDLADVAERTGHTTAQVIALHSEREYYV